LYVVVITVAQRECLKFKYNKELDKNRKLHNIVQETKCMYCSLFIQSFTLFLKCNYSRLHLLDFIFQFLFISTISENIRVFCWCRPLSKDETSSSKKSVVDFNGANDGEIMVTVTETTKKTLKFDRVFTPKDGQGTCLNWTVLVLLLL